MAKRPPPKFDLGVYDQCMTEDCPHKTQHKSGYCERCRTAICGNCSKKFVYSHEIDKKKPRCSWCKQKGH